MIAFYLRIGRGEYDEKQYLLVHIREMAKYLEKLVKGGDSIKQKILAEEDRYREIKTLLKICFFSTNHENLCYT